MKVTVNSSNYFICRLGCRHCPRFALPGQVAQELWGLIVVGLPGQLLKQARGLELGHVQFREGEKSVERLVENFRLADRHCFEFLSFCCA